MASILDIIPNKIKEIISGREEERELNAAVSGQQIPNIQKVKDSVVPKKNLTDLVITHEGLVPFQTPFRITDDEVSVPKGKRKMREWTSMFDKTLRIELDPMAKKAKGTENFLYLKRQEDLYPAVEEQFRRYEEYSPGMTVEQAIRKFDQTGPDGKLDFLEKFGINRDDKLSNHILMRRQ